MSREYPKPDELHHREQWDRYYEEVARHKKFIQDSKFFLDRHLTRLDFIAPNKSWTVAEIRERMMREIDMDDSMDAPNKPGYYRANND